MDDEYICTTTSACTEQNPYSYSDSKLCLSSCYPGDNIIEGTNICISSCSILNDNDNTYFFFEYDKDLDEKEGSPKFDSCVRDCSTTNKPLARKNGHCDINCDTNPLGDYFYSKEKDRCLYKINNINDEFKIDRNFFVDSCNS